MPKIRVTVDAKGIQRYTDVVFNPGDPMAISIDGREAEALWVNNECGDDPGLTVGQSESLADLLRDGVSLDIADDGTITVVEA